MSLTKAPIETGSYAAGIRAMLVPMLFAELAATWEQVAATSKRNEKIALLAALIAKISPPLLDAAVRWLAGTTRQGKLGVGWAALKDLAVEPAPEPTLELADVDAIFDDLATTSGPGSTKRRTEHLVRLFSRATITEARFLRALIVGEIRQGALESVILEAIARAASVPPASVRRAQMVASDLGAVARAAIVEGEAGLSRFGLTLFNPVQPMLASPADDVEGVLAELESAAFELKLDGARVQVHKSGEDVRVFTRLLNDVTSSLPELVETVRALPVNELILDGEAIALEPDGAPHPFQVTMRRFGRKLDVDAMRAELPLQTFFFDALRIGSETLIQKTTRERIELLEKTLPEAVRVPRIITADPIEASAFLDRAYATGHEGVMVKALDAPYEAGRRGASWRKLKAAHTLDLVILAAEWGSGRRQGWLSNLHLACRDEASGQLVMLGKTFKGLTDEMLAWQTKRLLELETHRDAWVVHVRPELVAEIAFGGVETSTQYPGGVALRFARVKRYRTDKRAEDADTLGAVKAIHAGQRLIAKSPELG